MNQPETLTAAAAARHIARGELAATELLEACLDQIRERDGEVAAWAHVDEAGARATARERDHEARGGGSADRCTACRSGSRTSSTSPA